MTITAKTLINAKHAANSVTSEYTVGSGKTVIIDKFTATNVDVSPRTISVYLVPSGGSAGATNRITYNYSISAGSAVELSELKNQILSTGDVISVEASAASAIVIRASGREIT